MKMHETTTMLVSKYTPSLPEGGGYSRISFGQQKEKGERKGSRKKKERGKKRIKQNFKKEDMTSCKWSNY
jgi:hypothetical protein